MKVYFRPLRFGLGAKCSVRLMALALLVALAPSSKATSLGPDNPLVPGGTAALLDATGAMPGALLADMMTPYSFTTTAGTTRGTVESAVYRESGGSVDFYFQVANSPASATAITLEINTSYEGFATDVYYRTDGGSFPLTGTTFIDGTLGKAPVAADRDATGSVVRFDFGTSDARNIHPGETSEVLIIATNASLFAPGNAVVSDGGGQIVASFQPTTGIPEPGSMMLMGGGLLALAAISKFRA